MSFSNSRYNVYCITYVMCSYKNIIHVYQCVNFKYNSVFSFNLQLSSDTQYFHASPTLCLAGLLNNSILAAAQCNHYTASLYHFIIPRLFIYVILVASNMSLYFKLLVLILGITTVALLYNADDTSIHMFVLHCACCNTRWIAHVKVL